jgi:class 3 adenylate cyclase/predicted ATPase
MRIGAKAERRQITVLFCDLVDSSSLAEALDPEDYRKVLIPFHTACRTVVEQLGGRVSQYLGDGVLIVFGHPHAHEDDAIRAARAALTILRQVQGIALPPQASSQRLHVRIGIATGLVVVGDGSTAGPDGHEPFSGQTPILAQRLQALASENGILISENTYRIVAERFECSELGPHRLKGFSEPEPVWSVTAERRSTSRFRRQTVSPLIGRQAEVQRLVDLWREAQEGGGRGVLVSGEAGIGKSRLLRGLLDRIGFAPRDTLLFQCESLYASTAFHPVIGRIRRAAGIANDDATPVKYDKLQAWYGDAAQNADALPLLGSMLSLPEDPRYPLPEQSAQLHKARLFEVLLEFLVHAAARKPLVIVLEDAHWIDPTTEEFVALLCQRIRDFRALLVCTCRPDYDPDWLARARVERLELAPLAQADAAELAKSVSAGKLDEYALQQVVGMADGVPLFIEELTKFVAEKSRDHALPKIPARLRDPLTERLDQVGEARLVAQVASVIGRQFSYVLMTSVYQGTEKALGDGLRRLQQAELIHAAPAVGDAWSEGGVATGSNTESEALATTYVFKHALLQEAAYETLLRDFRPELHRRTAEALEALFPQTVRDEPEVLAHHWTEAGQAEKGAAGWLRAGQLAAERCQYREAIARLRRGLALVPSIADGHVRRAQELALIVALGPALSSAEGGGTAEVNRLYARAMELCNETPLSTLHFGAHWGWWRTTMDHRTGRTRADTLLALAARLDRPELTLQAHHCQWATLYMVGRHRECCRHIEAGLAIYDGTRDRAHAASYGGHDARVCALGESALANWMLGSYAAAEQSARAALQWSAAINHVGSRLHAMDYAMVLQAFRRDLAAVRAQAQAMFDFASEQRLPVPRAKAQFFEGWTRALQGDLAAGIAEMTDGIGAVRAADTAHDFTLYYEMLAEAYELAGDPDKGLEAVREAFSISELKGIVYWNAELERRRGRLLAARGEREAARQAFEAALACARTQDARSLELRAAIALYQLRRDQGERPQASILRVACESLRDQPQTADLAQARALLEAGS